MNVLHFPGDCRDFDPEHVVGPDRFGALYRPVTVEYDDAADRTTITYKSAGNVRDRETIR